MDIELLRQVISDVKQMDDDFDFSDAISKNMVYTKEDCIYYFVLCWQSIPEQYLYETYKSNLAMIECGGMYNHFFTEDLIRKVKSLNHKDTIENPELLNLADDKGYINVYHGHCKPTLRNSSSWTTKKEVAQWFGERNSLFNQSKDYYVVSGKVKLCDIIAYITDRNEFEIVVQPKYVKHKTKEFFIGEAEVTNSPQQQN